MDPLIDNMEQAAALPFHTSLNLTLIAGYAGLRCRTDLYSATLYSDDIRSTGKHPSLSRPFVAPSPVA